MADDRAWYGRRAPAVALSAEFIRACAVRRADGMQVLTPPRGRVAPARPVREALGWLAGLATAAAGLWWALR